MKIKIIILMLMLMLITACSEINVSELTDQDLERISQHAIVCNEPYIRHGLDCCLDLNQNGICDEDEQKDNIIKTTTTLIPTTTSTILTSFISKDEKYVKTIIGGTKGIEANFEEMGIIEGTMEYFWINETFPVKVKIKNVGGFEIPKNKLNIKLIGLDRDSFNIKNDEMNNAKPIKAKSSYNPKEGDEIIDFGTGILYQMNGLYLDTNFYARIEYFYKTNIIVPEVCFNYDFMDNSLCNNNGEKSFSSTGAPIIVTKVTQKTEESRSIALIFEIENKGGGMSAAAGETITERYDSLNFRIMGENLPINFNCTNMGNENFAKLTDGKGTVICRSDELSVGTLYEKQVTLELSYIYRENIQKTLRIKNELKPIPPINNDVIKVIVLSDSRCSECDLISSQVSNQIKNLFTQLNIKNIDYNTNEGKELYDELGLVYLPAFLFDSNVKNSDSYPQLAEYIEPVGTYNSLKIGSSFDPSKEICDNNKDDTGNGLSDCQDPDCANTILCNPNAFVDCASNFGVSDDSVIYYYSETCPWCNMMKPGIEELEKQGYSFVWSDSASNKDNRMINSCFSDYIDGGVPQFICLKKNDIKVGAFATKTQQNPKLDLNAMKEWVDNCIN